MHGSTTLGKEARENGAKNSEIDFYCGERDWIVRHFSIKFTGRCLRICLETSYDISGARQLQKKRVN
jgi:hypothetical protein